MRSASSAFAAWARGCSASHASLPASPTSSAPGAPLKPCPSEAMGSAQPAPPPSRGRWLRRTGALPSPPCPCTATASAPAVHLPSSMPPPPAPPSASCRCPGTSLDGTPARTRAARPSHWRRPAPLVTASRLPCAGSDDPDALLAAVHGALDRPLAEEEAAARELPLEGPEAARDAWRSQLTDAAGGNAKALAKVDKVGFRSSAPSAVARAAAQSQPVRPCRTWTRKRPPCAITWRGTAYTTTAPPTFAAEAHPSAP